MNSLSHHIGAELNWIQTSMLERHFELYSENNRIGELRLEADRKAHGALIIGSPAAERWTFTGTGILKPRVAIRQAGANNDLAVYRPKLRGDGWVEFITGSRFQWKPTGFWGMEHGFYNEHKELLFLLAPRSFFQLKIRYRVAIEAQHRNLDELPVLLMLACYLKVLDAYAAM